MEKFKNLSVARKVVIVGALLTIISLFFHWGGWAGYRYTGLEMKGYLVIFALLYPLYNSYQNKYINKKPAIISLSIGLIFILYVRIVAFRNLFGNVPGQYTLAGMKFAIVGIIISMVGIVLTKDK